MVIKPTSRVTDNCLIGLSADGVTWNYIIKAAPFLGFKRGKKYKVEVDASNTTIVKEVTNTTTGKTWMDRNLGASRVAGSSTDSDAYGDLYQWGRGADGHQIREPLSANSITFSHTNIPIHSLNKGMFIIAPNSPHDWLYEQNYNLWQGASGTNNPCPAGFRLPTNDEWSAERNTWSSKNSFGAFNSPLRLPVAGTRLYSDGTLSDVNSDGRYWSSTIAENGIRSRGLYFRNNASGMDSYVRATGFSVRCIKD